MEKSDRIAAFLASQIREQMMLGKIDIEKNPDGSYKIIQRDNGVIIAEEDESTDEIMERIRQMSTLLEGKQ